MQLSGSSTTARLGISDRDSGSGSYKEAISSVGTCAPQRGTSTNLGQLAMFCAAAVSPFLVFFK